MRINPRVDTSAGPEPTMAWYLSVLFVVTILFIAQIASSYRGSGGFDRGAVFGIGCRANAGPMDGGHVTSIFVAIYLTW